MVESARSTRRCCRIRGPFSNLARVARLCRPSGRSRGSAWQPHGNAFLLQVLLEFAHIVNAEMEDAGGKRSIGGTSAEDIGKVLGIPRAAGGDHRNGDSLRYSISKSA